MNLGITFCLLFFIAISLVKASLPREVLSERASNSNGNIITINSDEFMSVFDGAGDRDYYLAVEFTAASPDSKCELCKTLHPIFESVAYTVGKKVTNANVYFVEIDAEDHLAKMKEAGLRDIPKLWIYPPFDSVYKSSNADPYDTRLPFPSNINLTSAHYEFNVPQGAPVSDYELLYAKFVSSICNVNVHIDKKTDISSILKSFIIFTVVFRLLKKKYSNFTEMLTDKNMYICICLFLIYINMSGFNFCIQRGVPFLTQSKKGKVQVLAGGAQYQQGSEMIISILFQLGFTVMLAALIVVPQYFSGPNASLFIISASTGLFLLYNVFTTMFIAKDHDYPFNAIEMFHQEL